MSRKRNTLDFEAALGDLEQIVEQLEQGELSLEDSMRAYERGVKLGRVCQQALDGAEQRMQVLAGKDADSALQDFADLEEAGSGDDDEATHDSNA